PAPTISASAFPRRVRVSIKTASQYRELSFWEVQPPASLASVPAAAGTALLRARARERPDTLGGSTPVYRSACLAPPPIGVGESRACSARGVLPVDPDRYRARSRVVPLVSASAM